MVVFLCIFFLVFRIRMAIFAAQYTLWLSSSRLAELSKAGSRAIFMVWIAVFVSLLDFSLWILSLSSALMPFYF